MIWVIAGTLDGRNLAVTVRENYQRTRIRIGGQPIWGATGGS